MIINDPYKALGVKKAINAAGTLTRIGGSRSPPEVFKAMEEASKNFVTIAELQTAAGKMIADATGAEAGLPTAGGSTSILLAAAACIMKGTELEEYEPKGPAVWRKIAQRLPLHTEGLRNEFVVQRCNRDEYDHAVQIAGGRFIDAGTEEDCSEKDLMKAFNPEKTAAYYYTHKSTQKGVPLEKIVEIAHRNGVPVIVDAATIPPPRSGLTKFSEMGVDLACFSGGKTLAGPNNSGLLSGRADLIKLAHLQSYPFEGIGRPSKMSRETIVGLITALNLYLETDDSGGFAEREKAAFYISGKLDAIPGITSYVDYIGGEAKTNPLTCVKADKTEYCLSTRELFDALIDGEPSIVTVYEPYFLLENYHGLLSVNPQFLSPEEIEIIINRIREEGGG
ncbi:MAG: aminotransferase class V-fold PLP-dependent enzyme [Candidatus Bathyarchaeota archaeon]|nr:aminotransferase class V-fold PLP-dependent enzyme [Candidatus Bathyarchaeota archaeon]